MKNIFTGFIFIFLDINFNFNLFKIDVLPDFVGYILMIKGLTEMSEQSPLFIKVKPYAIGMAVYTAILYCMDLLSVSFEPWLYLLVLVSTVISLSISFGIITGVKEIEEKFGTDLNGISLKSTWTFFAVFNIASLVFLWVPVLAIICVVVAGISSICFLVAFNRSKKLYYQMTDQLF